MIHLSRESNACVTRPPDFERLTQIVPRIDEFRFTIVRLPQGSRGPSRA